MGEGQIDFFWQKKHALFSRRSRNLRPLHNLVSLFDMRFLTHLQALAH
jgi:hypothetical protein